MGLDLVSFFLRACDVKLGLIQSLMRYPPSRVRSVAGMLCRCIYSLVTLTFCLQYHFFQSSLLVLLSLSDACGQISTVVRMAVGSVWNLLFINRMSLLKIIWRCLFTRAPLDWLFVSSFISQTRLISYHLTFRNHNYQLQFCCCL